MIKLIVIFYQTLTGSKVHPPSSYWPLNLKLVQKSKEQFQYQIFYLAEQL